MIYDAVYYINLDKCTDRQKRIENILKSHNINGTRYPAIDGNNIIKKNINKYFENQDYKVLTGNIGTLLSHTNLWKKIENEDNEIVLILEDDSVVVNDFNNLLENSHKEVPNDWDIIYVGSNKLKGTKLSDNIFVPTEGNFIGYNSGMFGYLIKKSSIPKLLNIIFPLPNKFNCIDVILRNNFSKFKAYFLINKLIIHDDKFESERLKKNKIVKV